MYQITHSRRLIFDSSLAVLNPLIVSPNLCLPPAQSRTLFNSTIDPVSDRYVPLSKTALFVCFVFVHYLDINRTLYQYQPTTTLLFFLPFYFYQIGILSRYWQPCSSNIILSQIKLFLAHHHTARNFTGTSRCCCRRSYWSVIQPTYNIHCRSYDSYMVAGI